MVQSPSLSDPPEANGGGRFGRYRALIRSFAFAGLTNLSNLLVVAVMVVAARMLGRDDFGALTYAQALAIIFMSPVNFGLEQLVIREVSRRRELAAHYLFNHMIWAATLAVTFLSVLAVASFTVFEMDGRLRLVVLLTAATWGLRIMTQSLQVYFRPFDRYDRESMIAGGSQFVYLTLGLLALTLGMDLIAFVIALLIARIIGFAIAFLSTRRHIGLSHNLEPGLLLRLQRQALPIGFGIVLTSTYTQIDTLILNSLLGLDDVGIYGAALRVYLALFMIPAILANVLLPRLSASFVGEDRRRHRRLVWGGGGLMFAVSLPVAVLGILVAPWIMDSVFGAEYAAGSRALQFLFVAAAVSFQVWYARILLIAVDRQQAMIWVTMLGLAVRAGLVYVLVQVSGVTGAAVAVLISESTMLVACWAYLALRRR